MLPLCHLIIVLPLFTPSQTPCLRVKDSRIAWLRDSRDNVTGAGVDLPPADWSLVTICCGFRELICSSLHEPISFSNISLYAFSGVPNFVPVGFSPFI